MVSGIRCYNFVSKDHCCFIEVSKSHSPLMSLEEIQIPRTPYDCHKSSLCVIHKKKKISVIDKKKKKFPCVWCKFVLNSSNHILIVCLAIFLSIESYVIV